PGFDVWADTTTLFIVVRRGDSSAGPILGKGILTIAIADFARQMTTLRVLNAGSLAERLAASARFGRFFAGVLQEVYGGVLAGPTVFHPDAPPRKRRALRAAPPEVHAFSAADGAQLGGHPVVPTTTRIRAGRHLPALLGALGIESLSAYVDTEANWRERLFDRALELYPTDRDERCQSAACHRITFIYGPLYAHN